jgi:hypothetical protein
VNRCMWNKCLSIKQRGTLMEIKKCIIKMMEATPDGDNLNGYCSYCLSANPQRCGRNRDRFFRALPLDSMDTIYQQMVKSQIAYHYNKVLDESIAEISLNDDLGPTYYRAPLITRISHFQNDD